MSARVLLVLILTMTLSFALHAQDCRGRDSCWKVLFQSQDPQFTLNCTGPRSCKGATIECQANQTCIVHCDGDYSCIELVEIQSVGSKLTLQCNGKGSCGLVNRCDRSIRDCAHACGGKCACYTGGCDQLGDTSCEMKTIGKLEFNMKCGVLVKMANELPYPPENADFLPYPSTFQLLFDYDVLPDNTTYLEEQLKPLLDDYIYKYLLVGVNLTTTFFRPMARLILVVENDIPSAEIGITGAVQRSIRRNKSFDNMDIHVETRIYSSSINVKIIIYGDETFFRANEFINSILIQAFVIAYFPVIPSDISLNFLYSSNTTTVNLTFPSGCPPPRPFFEPYCSKSGNWYSKDVFVDSPDVFLNDLVVNHLVIDEDVNILSSLITNSLNFTRNSNLTINHITTLQISNCPYLDGTLNIQNRTLEELQIGVPFAYINSTCKETDIGSFSQIKTTLQIPQQCLKHTIRGGTILILMDPTCTPSTEPSSNSQMIGTYVSIGLVFGIIFIVVILFASCPAFRSKVVPGIDMDVKIQKYLSNSNSKSETV